MGRGAEQTRAVAATTRRTANQAAQSAAPRGNWPTEIPFPGRWTEDTVRETARSYLEWADAPVLNAEQMKIDGVGVLYGAMSRFGGVGRWRQELRARPSRQSRRPASWPEHVPFPDYGWDEDAVRAALTAYLGGDGEQPIPRPHHMTKDGVAALYRAMATHGGLRYWQLQFPITESRERAARWQYPPPESQGWFGQSYHPALLVNGEPHRSTAKRESILRVLGKRWQPGDRIVGELWSEDYWAIEPDAEIFTFATLPSGQRQFAEEFLAEELRRATPTSVWRKLSDADKHDLVRRRGSRNRWVIGANGTSELTAGPAPFEEAYVVCFPLPRR